MTKEENKKVDLTNESPKGMGGAEPEYSAVTPETSPMGGMGVTPVAAPEQKINVSVPESAVTEAHNVVSRPTDVPERKPLMNMNMGQGAIQRSLDVVKNPWLVGQVMQDGVVKNFTFDEIKKQNPNLTPGEMLNSIARYREQEGLPALTYDDWVAIRGNNDPNKSYKQQKRDVWRHFLVDAIQPVSDVLKAAVAYGYGKAGRTYIPIDRGDGSARAMSDRMRRLEEVRAAQNWDAWADTFRNKERERLQQEAEARRAAARGRQREEDFEDFERRETYKREHQPPKSAVERMKESQANAYLNYVGRGMSHEDAAIAAGLVRRGKSGGSGGSRGTGGGKEKSPAYPYYVGDKPYSQEHFNDAVLHALSLEYPREDMEALSTRLAVMTPEAKLQMFKRHGRIVK